MENQEDKIIAYLRNEMNPDQRTDFEKELENDVELKQKLNFYQDLELAGEIFGEGGVKDQLEIAWQANHKTHRIGFSNSIWRYAAVVVLLLLAGILWYLQSSVNNDLPWKNKLQYTELLSQQRQLYKNDRIPKIDQLRFGSARRVRGALYHPALDTLLISTNPIVFEWGQDLLGQNLELEVFTKNTQQNKQKVNLPKDTTKLEIKLKPGLYYWNLNIKDEEYLGSGRFYVIEIK